MAWPMSQDYNEAIQNPASCFADADLRQAEAVCNALGLPVPCSGNFADVYQLRRGARSWAVKCFTRQIPGLQERYVQISAYLQKVRLPFMVDFQFLEQGIKVRGLWYPVLKMDWVEGQTLNAFVRGCLDKPQSLEVLAGLWVKLSLRLREANLAHCDLQHGNVLLVPGDRVGSLRVKLVDYDGMCVPALTLLKSIELGHPNYQHPQRAREGTYGLEVDRFSHLVIYTALRALMRGGHSLWEKYDNGDNLLFRQQDFEAPAKSPLFYELLKSSNAEVKGLVESLVQACRSSLEQTPLLDTLVTSGPVQEKRALTSEAATTPPARTRDAGGSTAETIFAAATATRRQPPRGRGRGKEWYYWAAGIGVALVGLVAGATVLATRTPPRDSGGETTVAWKDTPVQEPRTNTKGTGKEAPDPTRGKERPSESNPELIPEPRAETPERSKPPEAVPLPKVPLKEFTNSIGLRLLLIPAGKFWMGSPRSEKGRNDKHDPEVQHEVEITKPFYLGAFEVTQEEYEKVMGKNPSAFRIVPGQDTRRFPVETVSWDEAKAFCEKLSGLPAEKAAGRTYRLPTEAEWEHACRGGEPVSKDTQPYHFGATLSRELANVANDPRTGRTKPVGSYKPNAWGLFDMHGNVWEWCADWYGPYPKEFQQDPPGPPAGTDRVIRGGSWNHGGEACRAAYRGANPPGHRYDNKGFRVVCVLSPAPGTERIFRVPARTFVGDVSKSLELGAGTDLYVTSGQDLEITVTGHWRIGKLARQVRWPELLGIATGEAGKPTFQFVKGDASIQLRVMQSGHLFLGITDTYPGDNSGELTIHVQVR